jgi:hypothetical protein
MDWDALALWLPFEDFCGIQFALARHRSPSPTPQLRAAGQLDLELRPLATAPRLCPLRAEFACPPRGTASASRPLCGRPSSYFEHLEGCARRATRDRVFSSPSSVSWASRICPVVMSPPRVGKHGKSIISTTRLSR